MYGRELELGRIDTLLRKAETGLSGALVLTGDAGEGKTALLDRAARLTGTGWQVLRCAGVETESELLFAGLQCLLGSVPGGTAGLPIDTLPDPQADALRTAIGLSPPSGPVDRFQVGLATLSLLSELSAAGPVLCLIDDAHWLDQATADALRFAARRLGAEGVVLLFGTRGGFTVPGVPTLHPEPLTDAAARLLLRDSWPELETEALERVLAEAMGNPLALRELPRMAPDAPHVGPLPLPDRLRAGFEQRIAGLPEAVRRALLVVAAEETGDLGLVLRALAELELTEEALADAECSGMVVVDHAGVRFRHPLQRAAAYHSAGFTARRAVHAALGAALRNEPDRRAWHLAAIATGADENTAAAMETAAEHARERAGYSAAAAAMERAAQLTPDPERRAGRLVLAAEWAAEAGRSERAVRLAQAAERLPLAPISRARLDAARALMAFDDGALGRAHDLWMAAAAGAGAADPERAAIMLIQAGRASFTQGDLRGIRQARIRLGELTLPEEARPWLEGAMDGPLSLSSGDHETGIALIRSNVAVSRTMGVDEPSLLMTLAGQALLIGDTADAREITFRLVEEVRSRGMIGWFPVATVFLGNAELMLGRLREAETALNEGVRIARDIDQQSRATHAECLLAVLAAIRGDEQTCRELAERGLRSASGDFNFIDITHCQWALGLLDLGLGRYETALERLEALYRTPDRVRGHWIHLLRDLVEAAARLRRPERAAAAMDEIERWARALGTPFAEAIALRGRAALHGDGGDYERALKLQAAEALWYDYARTALLYGEWLRRERRRADARTQLRRAVEIFDRLGATLWADRARAELRATGESIDAAPITDLTATLTPQELQVVRLAAAGATNKEIAARLFLSPKTVGHHLYRAFPKLGVTSRMELSRFARDATVD
ncbi:AAA family ATPase [Nocardia sp. ET3-3]|uniref:AAA family ATPase n=1 Tax=Nocardia terrae TaxID=2675851 RepID=A0A7K1V5L3_9NOCA|nr:AAA family ATPase [Nocardia terrae]